MFVSSLACVLGLAGENIASADDTITSRETSARSHVLTTYNCGLADKCGPSVDVQKLTGVTRYSVEVIPSRYVSITGYGTNDNMMFQYDATVAGESRREIQYTFGAEDSLRLHQGVKGEWKQDHVRFANSDIGQARLQAVVSDYTRLLSSDPVANAKEVDWWLTMKCAGWATGCIAGGITTVACAPSCVAVAPCAACIAMGGGTVGACMTWLDSGCTQIGL